MLALFLPGKKWIIRAGPVKPVPVHNLPAPGVTSFYTLCKPDDVPTAAFLIGAIIPARQTRGNNTSVPAPDLILSLYSRQ